MVWPFSFLFSSSKAAPPPAKKATPARKSPVYSPATEARLIDAWEQRTVGELRDTLEEVGWDVESLERLLQRVGAPEESAGAVPQAAALRMLASVDKAKKRPRAPLLPDDDEEEDEEFDLSPRAAAGKKQARGSVFVAHTLKSPAATSPPRPNTKSPAATSPPRSNTKSPSRPSMPVAMEVQAMSPSQLKSEFERIFGYPPKSGNLLWLRRKLDALKKGTDLNVGSGNRGRPPTHVLPEGASP